jgi:hypothetical protein
MPLTQPRTELLEHTIIKLWQRWPHATDSQRNRFATIAQDYRELRGELDAQERRYAIENDVTLVEPYLADPACATARCAALGERPALYEHTSKMHRGEGRL